MVGKWVSRAWFYSTSQGSAVVSVTDAFSDQFYNFYHRAQCDDEDTTNSFVVIRQVAAQATITDVDMQHVTRQLTPAAVELRMWDIIPLT